MRSFFLFLALFFSISCHEVQEESKATTKEESKPLFRRLSYQRTGIQFANLLKESLQLNFLTFEYFANGAGLSIGDINNDGLPDLYFTGNMGPNRLYLNQGGLKFVDITRESGTNGGMGWSNGTNMIDINNDGWLDIYVCRSGNFSVEMRKNQLFLNNGDNTFREAAKEFGIDSEAYSTQSAFLDYDQDGDLDLYLLNQNISAPFKIHPLALKEKYDPLVGDQFFENRNGKFIEISKEVGLFQNPIGFGLGVAVGDLNNDDFPDLYVCNDYLEQDYLYLNSGKGNFKESLKTSTAHTSNFSMGCDISDFNNDGRPDIFVADMAPEDNYSSKTNMAGMNPERFNKAVENGFHYQYMINTLQMNQGMSVFSEVAQMTGLDKTDWSWAPLFVDLNNDGLKDALITNGYRMNSRNKDFEKVKMRYYKAVEKDPYSTHDKLIAQILELTPEIKIPNYVFENVGDLKFEQRIKEWGFHEKSFSNGVAYADLDLDGDLDIVINNIDQEVFLYENLAEGNYLRIKTKGSSQNPNGIGAKVIVRHGTQMQYQENYMSRGYLSSIEPIIHFGIPANVEKIDLEVIWSKDKHQIIKGAAVNQVIEVDFENAVNRKQKANNTERLFAENSRARGINFIHEEDPYDDFKKEILLPHKMSTLGPGIATGDINGDGLEDFFVGNASGYPAALYIQDKDGQFSKSMTSLWQKEAKYEDMDAEFIDIENDGDLDLYVVSGGNHLAENSDLYNDRLYINDGEGNYSRSSSSIPVLNSSGSCVIPEDFNGDGFIDLFVGGRVVPGRYPFPPKSYLLKNEGGGKFQELSIPEMENLGMVTSALWMDLNNDQKKDLVVAGEWMPVQAFLNNGEILELKKEALFENSEGWWFSLSKADLDNDGDEDLIAGNLGLNYKYKAKVDQPFHIYSGDLDQSGSNDIYLGYFQEGKIFPVRGRECSSQQMPFVKDKFTTYSDFGKATIDEVLGEAADGALHYQAYQFASMILWNENGNFNPQPLPISSQISAITSTMALDINEDGVLDIVAVGNLQGSEIETPRNDAGIGSILIGNKNKRFAPLDLENSGFLAAGDVKSMARIKLANGSYGILIARNSGKLSFFELNAGRNLAK